MDFSHFQWSQEGQHLKASSLAGELLVHTQAMLQSSSVLLYILFNGGSKSVQLTLKTEAVAAHTSYSHKHPGIQVGVETVRTLIGWEYNVPKLLWEG